MNEHEFGRLLVFRVSPTTLKPQQINIPTPKFLYIRKRQQQTPKTTREKEMRLYFQTGS